MGAVAFLLLSVLLLSLTFAQDFTARCIGVSDDDTISVLVGFQEVKVRLEGIDYPEGGQDFGSRAREFTSDLVFGEYVHVEPKEMDDYGRLVVR